MDSAHTCAKGMKKQSGGESHVTSQVSTARHCHVNVMCALQLPVQQHPVPPHCPQPGRPRHTCTFSILSPMKSHAHFSKSRVRFPISCACKMRHKSGALYQVLSVSSLRLVFWCEIQEIHVVAVYVNGVSSKRGQPIRVKMKKNDIYMFSLSGLRLTC